MAYEHRPDTGSVFKNERATTPQHPGYTGSALIGGVEYRVSIWVKNADDPNRKTFLSMKFEAADEWKKQYSKTVSVAPAAAVDDEIPF